MRKREHKILLLTLLLIVMGGCSSLVTTHNLTGSLLTSTHDSVIALHNSKVLSDTTYNKIRINWLRAQTEYVKSSVLLEKYLSNEIDDLTLYSESMTMISAILADIAVWLGEEKK